MMIEIENLTKSFGKTKALDGFSLKIEDNEIYGFVGQNGAGKTTTMRIISGLIPADSGKVIINGLDAGCEVEKVRSKIGYVPDFFGVYDNLKVIEYIEFFAAAYNMTGREAERECLRLLEELGLSDKTDFFVDDLSRGQKQRLGLARALIHNPDILVLDEPTSGMDPKGRVETRNLLKRLNAQGRTILISSHILHEISELVTGLAIIEKGKVVMSGSIDSIERTMHVENPIIMKVNKGLTIVAHRGFTKNAVENTLEALEGAKKAGLNYAEVDIMMTKDKKFIAMHDFNLFRLAKINTDIKDMLYDDLVGMEISNNGFTGHIVSFDDYVKRAKELGINLVVEIKLHGGEPDNYVDLFMDKMKELEIDDKYKVMSLDLNVVEKIHKTHKYMDIGYIMPFYFGDLLNADVDFFVVEDFSYREHLVWQALWANKKIYIWTVNKEKILRRNDE